MVKLCCPKCSMPVDNVYQANPQKELKDDSTIVMVCMKCRTPCLVYKGRLLAVPPQSLEMLKTKNPQAYKEITAAINNLKTPTHE